MINGKSIGSPVGSVPKPGLQMTGGGSWSGPPIRGIPYSIFKNSDIIYLFFPKDVALEQTLSAMADGSKDFTRSQLPFFERSLEKNDD